MAEFHLGESSGSEMTDATGNSHDGTYSAGGIIYSQPALTADPSTAVGFSSGSASVPNAPAALTAYTVEAWIKPTTVSAQNILTRTDSSGPGNAWSAQLRINSSGNIEHYLWDGSPELVTGTTVLQPGGIYHVVGTAANAGTMHLYVNGSEEGALNTIGTMWSGTQWALADRATTAYAYGYFDGSMDEVAIYNTALSGTRVGAQYQACAVPCAGDCSGNRVVTVDEILAMVNIALGNAALSTCPAGDPNHNSFVTVDEILTAVDNALNGCPIGGGTGGGGAAGSSPVTLQVGSASGPANSDVDIWVSITGSTQPDGTGLAAGTQLDILFNTTQFGIANPSTACTLDPGLLNDSLYTSLPTDPPAPAGQARLRLLVVDTSAPVSTFVDGTLVKCTFHINSGTATGTYTLTGDHQFASDALGTALPTSVSNGAITVLSSGCTNGCC